MALFIFFEMVKILIGEVGSFFFFLIKGGVVIYYISLFAWFTANKFKKENIWTLNVGKSWDVEALCDTRFDKWFDCICNLIGTKDHSGVWNVIWKFFFFIFFFFLVKNYLKWSKKLAPNSTILVDFTAKLLLLLFCLSHTWWQHK